MLQLCMIILCIWVYTCVCERERAREREYSYGGVVAHGKGVASRWRRRRQTMTEARQSARGGERATAERSGGCVFDYGLPLV